ncbi:MAG TPA: glycosyltransferase family 1 protein [Roseiarcus sp.]|nr:glycosyltransferase family 1 protein [Roseiarcus sp.]
MSDALFLRPRLRGAAASLTPPAPVEAGPRPVVYDMSHLIARLRAETGTGIDRIDLAFATHFFSSTLQGEAVRYGRGPPRRIASAWARQFTRAAQRVWTTTQSTQAEALWAWLEAPQGAQPRPRPTAHVRNSAPAWGRRLLSWAGHFVGSARRAVPSRAVYINVGYHRFEHPRLFSWLAARPDVDGVFMIHDLLPLDYPEYFAPGEADKFRERIATALRYGRAFLVSTAAVRRRLQREIEAHGLAPRPIWAHPFPSPLADYSATGRKSAHPYFVVVGTIEPRKNHLLLLNLWREMARQATPPRLVIIGVRGWENEQVLDMLDRNEILAPHVAEASNLSSQELAELIAGARAVLAPSFDEGYGLPIVEALALGVPVVASDTEAAREVSQGRAQLLSPIDGEGWRREIERLTEDDDYHAALKARAAGFVAPNWRDYFASLDQFLAGLRNSE